MRKKVLLLILTLGLMLVVSIPMAAPAPALAWSGLSTLLTMTAEQVGDETFELTIRETNDSVAWKTYHELSNVWVDLQPLGYSLVKDDSYYNGGDSDGDGLLDRYETWEWIVPVTVTAPTTFVAIGHGTTYDGYEITYDPDAAWPWPDGVIAHDEEERAEVTVEVAQPTVECGPCEGGVTELTLQYNGTAPGADIQVTDKKGKKVLFEGYVDAGGQFTFIGKGKNDKMGSEIKMYVNGVEVTKIHTSCSQPIGPGLVAGDFEVIAGLSLKGGVICPIPPVPDAPGCGECEGGVTELTLQYNGTTAANIVVKAKKKNVVLFDEMVAPGGQLTFTGKDKHGKLGSEIKIYVNGVEVAKIHTSCSQPIGIGMEFGDFEVIAGESRRGGPFCPPPEPGG